MAIQKPSYSDMEFDPAPSTDKENIRVEINGIVKDGNNLINRLSDILIKTRVSEKEQRLKLRSGINRLLQL